MNQQMMADVHSEVEQALKAGAKFDDVLAHEEVLEGEKMNRC